MKPTNRFYVGGPPLDPPDEPDECECCNGNGELCRITMDGWDCTPCPDCHGDDHGEPNDYPENL